MENLNKQRISILREKIINENNKIIEQVRFPLIIKKMWEIETKLEELDLKLSLLESEN